MQSVAAAWLSEQCGMLPGVTGAMVVLTRAGEGAVVAGWPQDGRRRPGLAAAAQTALTEQRPLTTSRPPGGQAPLGFVRLAFPFSLPNRTRGAVAFEIADAKPSECVALVERLRAGTEWLGVLLRREGAAGQRDEAQGADHGEESLTLVETALATPRLREAALAVATELATRLAAERVSIGLLHRGAIRVEAVSHSADFDARSGAIRALAAAMDEACDQDTALVHPAPAGAPPTVLREHEALSKRHGAGTVCTVPLGRGGDVVGAITAEWPRERPPEPAFLAHCQAAARPLGAALDSVQRAEAGPVARLRMGIREGLARRLGPDHPGARLAAMALLGGLLVLALARAEFRVTAEATLEGRVQRAVVAGLEGYIAQADARAGDVVRQGQVLGRLDERDLVLERRKWAGALEQLRKESREALAAHDRTRVNILGARLAQARAQLALTEEKLARTRWVAPFDGIVVRGDLSQALGSPVEKGDVLFEIAPLDGYRIVLEVDERDVAHVSVGQRGRLALAALPGESLPLTVDRITPVATAVDGRNVFRVEAQVDTPTPSLRPGMEGVAKIEIEPRPLLWIWTHRIVDTVRLWAWSWWP